MKLFSTRLCATVLAVVALGSVASAQQAPSGSTPMPPMVALPLPSAPPKGAFVLLGKNPSDLAANWYERRSTNAPKWTMDSAGVVSPIGRKDITSKAEFGDCFLHVEFKTPTTGTGNAGVSFHSRYEIQIHNSYGRVPESHEAGALYSQKAARVNASKPAGEWQTYDIIFRAPRFDAEGKLTEKPRATVFFNGVLVQNNEEFTGMTGIQYEQYKEMVKSGPISLQGDHDPVQFRNIWVFPL